MHKVYLLLRNNRQTGPYTLDELVSMQLRPFDLVWIEGRSFGWSYPSELEQLKPYVSEAPAAATPVKEVRSIPIANNEVRSIPIATNKEESPVTERTLPAAAEQKHIYVSLPPGVMVQQPAQADPAIRLEEKAEALRRRVQEYSASHVEEKPVANGHVYADTTPEPEELTTSYRRSLQDVEAEYASWMVKSRRAKKQRRPAIMFAALAVAAISGVVYLLLPADQPPAAVATAPSQQIIAAEAEQPVENIRPMENVPGATTRNEPPLKDQPYSLKTSPRKMAQKEGAERGDRKVATTAPPENSDAPVVEEEETAAVPTTPEKKKTLGAAISKLFKGLKKKPQEEEPVSSENTGSERRSTQREPAGEITDAALEENIRLRTDQGNESWMMGVHGMKLTLVNRNHVPLGAIVEVSYYTEQNTLVEKKTMQFSNVPAMKNSTLPVPDHRMADRAEFRVVQVQASSSSVAHK
ncbi:MAG TPA: hypothetical protein VFZ78_11470 [Flavisolibacter sp.]